MDVGEANGRKRRDRAGRVGRSRFESKGLKLRKVGSYFAGVDHDGDR